VSEDRIAELKARSEQIAALQAKFNQQPPAPSFEEGFFRLPHHEADGPGQITQPDGSRTAGSYAAAGVVEPTEIAWAQAMHLEPATAKQLIDTVKSLESQDRPSPNLLAGYTAGATSLADAESRRINHVMEAKNALGQIGGVYANTLAKSLDRLPRGVLDLLIKTVELKQRVQTERPR
jgi:hypothetical protein